MTVFIKYITKTFAFILIRVMAAFEFEGFLNESDKKITKIKNKSETSTLALLSM